MPSCVVKRCKNNTNKNRKSDGITFHTFPKNIVARDAWITAIRLSQNNSQWEPSATSVVCSEHFDKKDVYINTRGFNRITKTGYPQKKLYLPSKPVQKNDVNDTKPNLRRRTRSELKRTKVRSPSKPDVEFTAPEMTSASSDPDLSISPKVVIDNKGVVFPRSSSVTKVYLPVSSKDTKDSKSVKPRKSKGQSSKSSFDLSNELEHDKEKDDDDDEKEFVHESSRKHQLEKIAKRENNRIKKLNIKVKTLQQRVRRLQSRNSSLKVKLRNIKSKVIIDTNLKNSATANMVTVEYLIFK